MPTLTSIDRANVRKLLDKCALFRDPEFPAVGLSLGKEEGEEDLDIAWKRPHELVDKPELFVDGASRGDVRQGRLGDCWFLAACTSVASRPDLIREVIPDGQILYGNDYKGLVTFRLWRMGEWLTVFVDDLLPVMGNKLLYARCNEPREFWLPLLEKAFAKFHGGYSYISGGLLGEALISLTGAITQTWTTESWDMAELFERLRMEARNGSLITCARWGETEKGLIDHHAYTVTGAKRLRSDTEGVVRLVRVRNPHGQAEWTGDWSDGDVRWDKVSDAIKKEFSFIRADDGEFWMRIASFIKYFHIFTIATRVPDHDNEHLITVRDMWAEGVNAGGGREDIVKYATNPQYLLTVTERDDDDQCEPGEAIDPHATCKRKTTCEVLLQLVQENHRCKYPQLYEMTVHVYKTSKPHQRLTAEDLKGLKPFPASDEFSPLSSCVCKLALKPGAYVVVPCTHTPGLERDFLLRTFARKPIDLSELV